MKIKTFVKFEDEIEVDVSPDDIMAMFIMNEEFNSDTFMRVINSVASFLNGVPKNYITENLTASQRETIRHYLRDQSARFI